MQLQIHPPLDLLAAEDGRSLLNEPLIKRRSLLEKFATAHFDRGRIRLSPATLKLAQAKTWLAKTGTMLDGIVAKRRHVAYRSGERDGMQKIKNFRTADCVVGGFRYAGGGNVVGSLLPGLYDSQGLLHHVGFTSSLAVADRLGLTNQLSQKQSDLLRLLQRGQLIQTGQALL